MIAARFPPELSPATAAGIRDAPSAGASALSQRAAASASSAAAGNGCSGQAGTQATRSGSRWPAPAPAAARRIPRSRSRNRHRAETAPAVTVPDAADTRARAACPPDGGLDVLDGVELTGRPLKISTASWSSRTASAVSSLTGLADLAAHRSSSSRTSGSSPATERHSTEAVHAAGSLPPRLSSERAAHGAPHARLGRRAIVSAVIRQTLATEVGAASPSGLPSPTLPDSDGAEASAGTALLPATTQPRLGGSGRVPEPRDRSTRRQLLTLGI